MQCGRVFDVPQSNRQRRLSKSKQFDSSTFGSATHAGATGPTTIHAAIAGEIELVNGLIPERFILAPIKPAEKQAKRLDPASRLLI